MRHACDTVLAQRHACDCRDAQVPAAVWRRDGQAAGLQEGRQLGQAKGFEIGYEVGLYQGELP